MISIHVLARLARRSLVGASLGAVLATGALGCASVTPDAEPGTKIEAQATSAVESAPRGTGFGAVIADSLRAVDLRADQRARVASLELDLRRDAEPVRVARKDVADALADGVARGAVDEAVMGSKIDALARAAGAMAPSLQATLDELHATLDASQRKALVAEVRTKAREKHALGERREHLKKIADELGLTAEQKAAARDAVKSELRAHGDEHVAALEKGKERLEAIALAFEGDAFDAKTLGVGEHLADLAKARATRVVKMTRALLPTLSEAQRAKLATMLRERADKLD